MCAYVSISASPDRHHIGNILVVSPIRSQEVVTGLPWWLSGKESVCNYGDAGDAGSVPGSGRFPEEDMATHSSILAWRIPGTEEPGGLQSMESQSVRHTWL